MSRRISGPTHCTCVPRLNFISQLVEEADSDGAGEAIVRRNEYGRRDAFESGLVVCPVDANALATNDCQFPFERAPRSIERDRELARLRHTQAPPDGAPNIVRRVRQTERGKGMVGVVLEGVA